jgi:hypothetical protein
LTRFKPRFSDETMCKLVAVFRVLGLTGSCVVTHAVLEPTKRSATATTNELLFLLRRVMVILIAVMMF